MSRYARVNRQIRSILGSHERLDEIFRPGAPDSRKTLGADAPGSFFPLSLTSVDFLEEGIPPVAGNDWLAGERFLY